MAEIRQSVYNFTFQTLIQIETFRRLIKQFQKIKSAISSTFDIKTFSNRIKTDVV